MGRTVVVTGASRGLGLEIAKKFLENGDFVLGISKTQEFWKEASQSLKPLGRFQLFKTNLADSKAVKVLSSQLPSRIDILINNAGYGGSLQRIDAISLKEYHKVFEENLDTAFLLTREILPRFQKQKNGLIVNISSMAGKRGVPKLFAYSASKAALIHFSQCLAKEYASEGIRSFSICPGGINTQMRADLFGKEDAVKQQSAAFVADVIFKTITGEIAVDSGGDIVIRHCKITEINPVPGI